MSLWIAVLIFSSSPRDFGSIANENYRFDPFAAG